MYPSRTFGPSWAAVALEPATAACTVTGARAWCGAWEALDRRTRLGPPQRQRRSASDAIRIGFLVLVRLACMAKLGLVMQETIQRLASRPRTVTSFALRARRFVRRLEAGGGGMPHERRPLGEMR